MGCKCHHRLWGVVSEDVGGGGGGGLHGGCERWYIYPAFGKGREHCPQWGIRVYSCRVLQGNNCSVPLRKSQPLRRRMRYKQHVPLDCRHRANTALGDTDKVAADALNMAVPADCRQWATEVGEVEHARSQGRAGSRKGPSSSGPSPLQVGLDSLEFSRPEIVRRRPCGGAAAPGATVTPNALGSSLCANPPLGCLPCASLRRTVCLCPGEGWG